MILKFHPRGDDLVSAPGLVPVVGQAQSYVGRTFDPATRAYPAVAEAFEIDSHTATADRLAFDRCRRDASLWAADKETAAYCGVDYVAVSLVDGVFVPPRALPPLETASYNPKPSSYIPKPPRSAL